MKNHTQSLYLLIGMAAILPVAILTFSGSYITVDPYSPDVIYVATRWWGLSKQERVIKWMDNGKTGEAAWMAKDQNGRWYPFIVEQPDTPMQE